MPEDVVRVGLLGCGHVGSALVRLITDNGDSIETRTGVRLEVAKVAVRNLSRERDVALPASVFTERRRTPWSGIPTSTSSSR